MSDKHIIIGTAGHVDHGKTTLIRALTGIDTDRLKEEKERGMTIDLGFASFSLPGGRKVGIVDVPGHERFLKNMLAGATGVDLVLLVIAADEGVMPQTREHLEILELLEAKKGVVALTKVDMVDEEWLEVVEEDVRQSLAGTFLDGAPIVRVSGVTGEGVSELVSVLARIVEEIDARSVVGPFRLPVDRVFTMTGFGTVVTGTLVSGSINVGDAAEILPQGIAARVRGLHVHGVKHDRVEAGNRVAVNLVGVEVGDLARGSVLVPPGYLRPSRLVDVLLRVLPEAPGPVTSRARVRLHIGTAEVLGRLKILDREQIPPGGEGLAQFAAETPVVSARGDRFVIRSYSPMRTIGGGVVLVPNAPRRRRFDPKAIEALAARKRGDAVDLVEDALLAAAGGSVHRQLAESAGLSEEIVSDALAALTASGRAKRLGPERWIHETNYAQTAARIEAALQAYHESNRFRAGMPREELRLAAARAMDVRTFGAMLAALEAAGRVVCDEKSVRLTSHEVRLDDEEQRLSDRIEELFRSAGLNPPSVQEATAGGGQLAHDIFALLVERGRLVKLAEDCYLHADALAAARSALVEHLKAKGQITVSEFRDLVGSSRKYIVPLLEYFDAERVTRRVGDIRVLARSSPPHA